MKKNRQNKQIKKQKQTNVQDFHETNYSPCYGMGLTIYSYRKPFHNNVNMIYFIEVCQSVVCIYLFIYCFFYFVLCLHRNMLLMFLNFTKNTTTTLQNPPPNAIPKMFRCLGTSLACYCLHNTVAGQTSQLLTP